MKEKDKIATTVKIPSTLYDDFKVLGIRHKVSLQTLVEKCINLFVLDPEFRTKVTSYDLPKIEVHIPLVITGSCDP